MLTGHTSRADTRQIIYDHAVYLHELIQIPYLRLTIQWAKLALAKYSFDAIAVRGVSGLLIGPALALELDKTLIVVRKPGDHKPIFDGGSHSGYTIEGDISASRYVIVDDCVSSGTTAKEILRKIEERYLEARMPQPRCLGVLETGYRSIQVPEHYELNSGWLGAHYESGSNEV